MFRFLVVFMVLFSNSTWSQSLNERIVKECEKVRPIENSDTVYFALLAEKGMMEQWNLKDTCVISSNVSIWVGDSTLKAPLVIKYGLAGYDLKKQFKGKRKNVVFTVAMIDLVAEDESKKVFHIYWTKHSVKKLKKMKLFGFYLDYKSVVEYPTK